MVLASPAARPQGPDGSARPEDWRPEFASLERWLVDGGDVRLDLEPASGANRYGCPPAPDPAIIDFASSTGSVISPRGWAAARALATRLEALDSRIWRPVTYARELARMRGELAALYGLDDLPGLDIVFAASGTDAHLILSELIGDATRRPLICMAIEPEETGSGAPAALQRRHFSTITAQGARVTPGEALGVGDGGYATVPARAPDGSIRSPEAVAADIEAILDRADQIGRRVVLSVTDVSKTGLIAPDLDTVARLAARHPDMLQVVIDACQLRLSPASLRAYLERGFIVAVTGSKFLSGPSFSGAVFVPAQAARRLRGRRPSPGLAAYAAAAEFPVDWAASADLPETANYGLLLRWEAALAELAAFRALDETKVAAFTERFADSVRTRLTNDPAFEPLPVAALDRSAIGAPAGWDSVATIFPFLLKRDGVLLDRAQTEAVYRRAIASGLRVGQPVSCGLRDGVPVSALRVCNSARLIVEAVEGGEDAVIARGVKVLGRVAELAC